MKKTIITIDREKTRLVTVIPYANQRGDKVSAPFIRAYNEKRYTAYYDGEKKWSKTDHSLYFNRRFGRPCAFVDPTKISKDYENPDMLIDEMMNSYAVHVSPIIAAWYTRQRLAKSGSESTWNKNLKDYYEVCAFCRSSQYSVDDYALYLDREHENLFTIPNLKKYSNGKMSKADAVRKSQKVLQYAKRHTYKMATNKKGKKYRAQIMPYVTIENTSMGQHVFSLDNVYHEMGSNGLDIIQKTAETLVYLMRCGLVYTWRDIKQALHIVKVFLDDEYTLMDKRAQKTITLESVQDRQSAPHNSMENRLESESMLKSVRKHLIRNLPKRCNLENVLFVYDHCLIGSDDAVMSMKDASEFLQVNLSMVYKYMGYIQKILQSESTKKLVYGE